MSQIQSFEPILASFPNQIKEFQFNSTCLCYRDQGPFALPFMSLQVNIKYERFDSLSQTATFFCSAIPHRDCTFEEIQKLLLFFPNLASQIECTVQWCEILFPLSNTNTPLPPFILYTMFDQSIKYIIEFCLEARVCIGGGGGE